MALTPPVKPAVASRASASASVSCPDTPSPLTGAHVQVTCVSSRRMASSTTVFFSMARWTAWAVGSGSSNRKDRVCSSVHVMVRRLTGTQAGSPSTPGMPSLSSRFSSSVPLPSRAAHSRWAKVSVAERLGRPSAQRSSTRAWTPARV